MTDLFRYPHHPGAKDRDTSRAAASRASVLHADGDRAMRRRFEAKFIRGRTDECWLWNGAKGASGHGQFFVDGSTINASRAAWLIFVGDILPGQVICHRCDIPACVNPKHLFVGTQLENMRDCVAKGRNRLPLPQLGEKNASAKLTPDLVISIRQSPEQGKVLARRLGLSATTISDVRTGKTWRHLPGAPVYPASLKGQRR